MAGLPVLRIYNTKWKGWKKRTVFFLFSASVVSILSLSSLILGQETAAHNETNILLIDKELALLPYNIRLQKQYQFSRRSEPLFT